MWIAAAGTVFADCSPRALSISPAKAALNIR